MRLFLVDDGIDGDRSFACLPVADDQLSLATANWNHGIDGLQTGLDRLIHRAAIHYPRSQTFEGAKFCGLDRPFTIQRLSQRIDDATDQRLSHGHRHDASSARDLIPFFNVRVFAEEHDANRLFFEVQRQAVDVAREQHHLAVHDMFETIDAGHAIADEMTYPTSLSSIFPS